MRDETRRTDARGLTHPLFWAALVVLVLNDHLLKGSGVLPGWLTGKLSDFAGLIVAPIVLSALLRSSGSRRRAVAFLLVGGWFAAANLVPPVARATESLGALIGVSWTFWADPTDLVALTVLPLAWEVAAHRRQAAGSARLLERFALGLAIAASIASPTPPDPTWNTAAFLVNRTERPVTVHVRWVEADVDCRAVRTRFEEILSRDAFAAGTRFSLDPGEVLPLDRGLAAGGDGLGGADPGPWLDAGPAPWSPTHVGVCDVAILTAEGLTETMVFWERPSATVVPLVVEDDDDLMAVDGGLQLFAVGEDGSDEEATELRLEPRAGYRLARPIEAYDGGSSCRDYGSITGFGWSDLPDWDGDSVLLREVRETVDGCVSVQIDAEGSSGSGGGEHHAFVCVPPADFPFLSNSRVQIWNGERQLRIVRDLPLEDGTRWRTGELVIARGVDRLREGPFDVSLVAVDADCEGVRMGCGGFRVPSAGGLSYEDGVRFVHPGELVERDAEDGRRARLRVGRAETIWVTRPACGAGRDELGPRLEALVMYGEEPR